MKYLYYKSEKGNFGDDLNAWLWPQLIKNSSDTDDTYFLGIGSILYNKFKLLEPIKDAKKIVFGSGIRPTYDTFKLDDTWDIKFLRGPLSGMTLKNKYEYISDAAYAIRLVNNFERFLRTEKKHKVAVMPYFKSIKYFDWQKICDELGFYFINPESGEDVEDILNKISSCSYIITEAMHGAILADILRVPWSRFILSTPHTEGQMISEFKWMDWLFSVNLGNIEVAHIKFYKEFYLGKALARASSGAINAKFLSKGSVKNEILQTLSNIKNFNLSGDNILNTVTDKIAEKLEALHMEGTVNARVKANSTDIR